MSALAQTAPATVRSVLLYLPQLKLGGAEISILRLAQGLQARGVAVALAVHRADPAAQALAGDIELLSLDAGRTLAVPRRLAQLLRQRRPDVLVSALTHSNIVAALAARGTGVRTVLTEHAPIASMRRLDRSRRYRATVALSWKGRPHSLRAGLRHRARAWLADRPELKRRLSALRSRPGDGH